MSLQMYQSYSKQQPNVLYVPWQSNSNMGFADQTYGSYYGNPYGNVTPMYQQRRRGNANPYLCAGIIITLVIIIALSVGLPLGLLRPWEDGKMAGTGGGPGGGGRGTRQSLLTGELTINNFQYSPILSDPNSATFKEYSDFICGKVVSHVESVAESLTGCEVKSFREGSLVANYQLTMTLPDTMSSQEESQLIKAVSTEIQTGVVEDETLDVEPEGVIFQDGNACLPDRCDESHECVRLPFSYECRCPESTVEEDGECVPDSCEPNPCQNNGECVRNGTDFHCDCMSGYDGETCQDVRTACSYEPCQHGATCLDVGSDFSCICAEGFDGKTCSNGGDGTTPAAHDMTSAAHDMTPATHDMTPATNDMTPATHDMTPATHDMTPATHDMTPATHDMTPATHDMTPATHDMTPATHDMTPATHDMTSVAHDMTPATQDMTPATHDMSSIAHDMTSAAHDMTTAAADVDVTTAAADEIITIPDTDDE